MSYLDSPGWEGGDKRVSLVTSTAFSFHLVDYRGHSAELEFSLSCSSFVA